jgi:hypothetical protein
MAAAAAPAMLAVDPANPAFASAFSAIPAAALAGHK